MPTIDLDLLCRRESERIEWKENVADPLDVVETIVAFANDFSNLGGGYVVCGAQEGKDLAGFPKVSLIGLTASRLKEVEGRVLNSCRDFVDPPLVPVVEEIPIADREKRVLVFIVPATQYAHQFRREGKGAIYYIRSGRRTIEARNGLLRELLVRKGTLEPWDRRPNPKAKAEEIDLFVLKACLDRMGMWDPSRSLEEYLSPEFRLSPFSPPLCAKTGLDGHLIPRNFSLLLFSREPSKFFPGAYSVFSVYPGNDRSVPTAERKELIGPVTEQAKRLIELLNSEAYQVFDKENAKPNQEKYPIRALQEALVNALVHRDYESDQPTRITVFSDRIEILSPGALPRAIDLEKFIQGKASPFWKNQSLAYFFNRLQLAQAEGQGIPTIFRTMKETGCPDPKFTFGEETVMCLLPAHPRHEIMRLMKEIEGKVVLGKIQEALVSTREILMSDPYNFRAMELFCNVCNMSGNQKLVWDLIKEKSVDIRKFHPQVILIVAEALSDDLRKAEVNPCISDLLEYVSKSRLEEGEIKKLVLGYRKMGDNEKAISVIAEAIGKNPALRKSASLLQIKGKAQIDLAKKCIDTTKNKLASTQIKARAWDECRSYLLEAEKDLKEALECARNAIEREYIEKDLEFLKYMQEIARKPGVRHPRFKRKR